MSDSKFLFDRNNFDEPKGDHADDSNTDELINIIENAEPEPPPPPSFTQDDIDRATRKGIEQGKKDATEQLKNEETVRSNRLLGQIKAQIDTLIMNESDREDTFEQNTIALIMAINDKIFPMLNKKFGTDQIKSQIKGALAKQKPEKSLTVTVSDALYATIKTHCETQQINGVIIEKDDVFDELQCVVTWSDGGIIMNTTHMAEKTQAILNDLLEKRQKNDQDEN